MKKLIFLFIFISNFSNAQDWSLFPTGDILCYQKLNSKYITNTLIVDTNLRFSVSILPCDTCIHLQGKYYTYQSDFLAKEYKIDTNGNVILYNNRDTSILYLNKSIGFSWNFNSNITANISSIKYTSIFSTSDSIKTILFSNGDSMLVSKNYGVVLFKHPSVGYLKLVGNHSKNYGERLFNIGKYNILGKNDFFSYVEYRLDGSGGFYCDRTDAEIFKIKKVDTINNSIYYLCDSKIVSKGYYDCSNYKSSFYSVSYQTNKSFYVKRNETPLLNQFRFNSTTLYGLLSNISGYSFEFNGDTIYNFSGVDNRGLNSKKYLTFVKPGLYKVDSTDGMFYWYNYPILFQNSYETSFEQSYRHALGGYIKNGISYGLTDTNIYLGVNTIKPFTFSVFPQPNNGEFNIALNDAVISENINITILDINGRIVFTKEYDENNLLKVEANTLKNGVYILKISIGEGESFQKLIIDQNTSQ